MATSKTKRAQAAIDSAQAALEQAEDALGVQTPEAKTAVAEATYEAIVTYDQPETPQDAAEDAPIEAATDVSPEPRAASSEPVAHPDARFAAFTVADALTYQGVDAQFPSSHPIHRTMIAVAYHPDGTASVGMYIEQRPERFHRDQAATTALFRALEPDAPRHPVGG